MLICAGILKSIFYIIANVYQLRFVSESFTNNRVIDVSRKEERFRYLLQIDILIFKQVMA